MKRAALLSTVAITAAIFGENGEALAQCVNTTDCASLGYTETSCTDGGLKCPFGNTWSCKETAPTEPATPTAVVLGECNGYAANCTIGQILNSDGTCTSDVTSGKSPLGVVIAIKDNCGWAMTASPIATNIAWGGYGTDITNLSNYTTKQTAATDFNACENTQKITQTENISSWSAAWVAVNYTPTAAPSTKDKWCLPSAGMLNSICENLDIINNSILKLGGTKLYGDTERIWSSTEYNNNYAWNITTNGVCSIIYDQKVNATNIYTVRPVLPF